MQQTEIRYWQTLSPIILAEYFLINRYEKNIQRILLQC